MLWICDKGGDCATAAAGQKMGVGTVPSTTSADHSQVNQQITD